MLFKNYTKKAYFATRFIYFSSKLIKSYILQMANETTISSPTLWMDFYVKDLRNMVRIPELSQWQFNLLHPHLQARHRAIRRKVLRRINCLRLGMGYHKSKVIKGQSSFKSCPTNSKLLLVVLSSVSNSFALRLFFSDELYTDDFILLTSQYVILKVSIILVYLRQA